MDFSGLDEFSANLDQILVGTAVSAGSASGTLLLAEVNAIDASTIVIGEFGGAKFRLGRDNTIVANELIIGRLAGRRYWSMTRGLVRRPW